jgi:hypothetical protein
LCVCVCVCVCPITFDIATSKTRLIWGVAPERKNFLCYLNRHSNLVLNYANKVENLLASVSLLYCNNRKENINIMGEELVLPAVVNKRRPLFLSH